MFKAGVWSVLLLLASRLLGLARESGVAAAFGLSGVADAAVLMLSVPDWLAGVAVGGALSYVLLPLWAALPAAQRAAAQRRVAVWLCGAGVAVALALFALRHWAAPQLMRALPPSGLTVAAQGLAWAAWGIPAALLAALWATRLQFEGDAVGLYAASVVVNAVLIGGLGWLAHSGHEGGDAVFALGAVLLLALALRLAWQGWRLRRWQPQPPQAALEVARAAPDSIAWPDVATWLWAALAAGLPLTLPFAARSLASATGAGALAQFNYAWKLIELPLMLAVQLVAVLAFSGIARALTGAGADAAQARQRVRSALALAWVLAGAAVLALHIGGDALAGLLFGWGRMDAQSVARVARWGRWGAWGLLPQALIAVLATVLATRQRLRPLALANAAALGGLLAAQAACGPLSGQALMGTLNAALALVAAVSVAATVRAVGALDAADPRGGRAWVPWRLMAVSGALLLVLVAAWWWLEPTESNSFLAPVMAGFSALFFIAIATAFSADLRQALRR